MYTLLNVDNIECQYRGISVVRKLSFAVTRGSIVGTGVQVLFFVIFARILVDYVIHLRNANTKNPASPRRESDPSAEGDGSEDDAPPA